MTMGAGAQSWILMVSYIFKRAVLNVASIRGHTQRWTGCGQHTFCATRRAERVMTSKVSWVDA